MLFPFTFTMSVPGIINPFSNPPFPFSGSSDSPALAIASHLQEKRPRPIEHRPHPSSLPPPEPLARKRGWQPSSPEPSRAATITASTRGYLDARPRYRDFTVTPEAREGNEGAEMAAGEYFCIVDHSHNTSLSLGAVSTVPVSSYVRYHRKKLHVALDSITIQNLAFCAWLP
jgi:hypothetical protein